MTSGGFAHFVDKSMAQGYVPKELADDLGKGAFDIEIIGEQRKATIIVDPPFDPKGERMRMREAVSRPRPPRKLQRRVGEPVVDAEGEGAQRVDFEAGFAHAMDQHGGVVDAGHGEYAGLEDGGVEIEGDAFAENITGRRAFDEDPGAAVGERREDGDAVQLRCDGVILRADDPELVFPGAHEGAAIGLQARFQLWLAACR